MYFRHLESCLESACSATENKYQEISTVYSPRHSQLFVYFPKLCVQRLTRQCWTWANSMFEALDLSGMNGCSWPNWCFVSLYLTKQKWQYHCTHHLCVYFAVFEESNHWILLLCLRGTVTSLFTASLLGGQWVLYHFFIFIFPLQRFIFQH